MAEISKPMQEYFGEPIPVKENKGQPLGELLHQARYHRLFTSMHRQPLRFPMHEYDPDQKRRDLGGNVDPVVHQLITGYFTAGMLSGGRLDVEDSYVDPRDGAIGVLAGAIHDIDEITDPEVKAAVGEVIGDIPYGHKTDADREIGERVFGYSIRRILPQLAPSTVERIETIVSHRDRELPEWQAYKGGHKLVEIETGIAAGFAASAVCLDGLQRTLDYDGSDLHRLKTQARLFNEVIETEGANALALGQSFQFAHDLVEAYRQVIEWHQATGGFEISPDEVRAPDADIWEAMHRNEGLLVPRNIGELAVYNFRETKKLAPRRRRYRRG